MPARTSSRSPCRSARVHLSVAAAFLLSGVAPAAAQFFERPYGPFPYNAPPPVFDPFGDDRFGGRGPLPPSAIIDRLEDRGFEDVGRPRFNGRAYVVDATTPRGRRVTLLIDPYRGAVIDRMPLGDPRGRDEIEAWVNPPGPGPVARPSRPFPPEEAPDLRPRGEPPRREAARPNVGPVSPAEPAVRLPADPRVAPEPGTAGRPLEGRAETPRREPERAPRAASRPEPGPSGGVYGTNPGAAAPARRPAPEPAKPAQSPAPPAESRTTSLPPTAPSPAARPVPSPAVPTTTAPAARPVPPAAERPPAQASAEPTRPRGPVRVIEGVTPINPGSANPAAPASPSPPASGGPAATE